MKQKLIIPLLLLLSIVLISGTIDLNNLDNYANQPIPAYIIKDNTPSDNPITDEGATLGRVLFYDKKLSLNNSIACGSCHIQEHGFGDPNVQSEGLNGFTGRHSMRLINVRFSNEGRMFWDERATSVEDQSTQPIQDHVEMGFSGTNGDPDIDSLIRRMEQIPYYEGLFTLAFGDAQITEGRMQRVLAQFVRSIQSFDSKYDVGRVQVTNNGMPFPNFTANENAGKALFMTPSIFDQNGIRIDGGAGCNGCHRAPEFDILPASFSNGFIESLGGGNDYTNTRSPTLRDLMDINGDEHGPLMHDGSAQNIGIVINHYNNIPTDIAQPPHNQFIDLRLLPEGNPQRLQLTQQEIGQLIAFLRTLTGNNVYTDPKWSDPFDPQGEIVVVPIATKVDGIKSLEVKAFPNPVLESIHLELNPGKYTLRVINVKGQQFIVKTILGNHTCDMKQLPAGIYFVEVQNVDNIKEKSTLQIIKE